VSVFRLQLRSIYAPRDAKYGWALACIGMNMTDF